VDNKKMAKSKSSKGWLKEHFDDEYVRRSQMATVPALSINSSRSIKKTVW